MAAVAPAGRGKEAVMNRALFRTAVAVGALPILACGSSPTEPSSVPQARTTVRITVTACSLGGSVVVRADGPGNDAATLPTPGEVTLSLTPGPHALTYQRGDDVFAANPVGAPDPLGSIPAGGTASVTLVDPPQACMALAGQSLAATRPAGAR